MIQKKFVVFTAPAFLFLTVFFAPSLIASQENPDKPLFNRSIPQSEIRNPKTEGKCIAPKDDVSPRPLRERDRVRGVSLKEEIVGGKISEVKGEKKSETSVNYFKGKDPSKWKTNISTYDIVSLGEVYEGIELKLKAYGKNVEKLFCVKPGADPDQIKIKLSGIQPPESPWFTNGEFKDTNSRIFWRRQYFPGGHPPVQGWCNLWL